MAEKVRHGLNGLLFRAGSPEDLADRLTEALTTPDLWQRLRDQRPQPPDLTGFATQHLAVYRRIIADRQPAPKRVARSIRRKAA